MHCPLHKVFHTYTLKCNFHFYLLWHVRLNNNQRPFYHYKAKKNRISYLKNSKLKNLKDIRRKTMFPFTIQFFKFFNVHACIPKRNEMDGYFYAQILLVYSKILKGNNKFGYTLNGNIKFIFLYNVSYYVCAKYLRCIGIFFSLLLICIQFRWWFILKGYI